ncbi:LLM class F420-dependent oxidoreductase [Micromonospora arborensis]|uniref:LLM class F420-dependent oxidoreductase n=1 Tax=Micromonospora arborensis TaxID=2116518 RepID=UPI00341677F9
MTSWGVNLPLSGLPLTAARELIQALPDLGYTDVWTGEGGGTDAFTPLTAAAAWQPRLSLGTGVVPVGTRGPGVLAQTVGALAELTSGAVLLGVGSSVPAHVTALNGVPFGQPLARVRDTVRFLRRALAGEVVSADYETFSVQGFRLDAKPEQRPRVLVGALRPKMVRVGYEDADGVVLNLLAAADLPRVLEPVQSLLPGRETVVKLFVCPTGDADHARAAGRGFLGWILNQTPYHAFHSWLGRGDELAVSKRAADAGDRIGAGAAIPDHIVDELWIHGDPARCVERITRYLQPGVTRIVLYVAGTPELARRPQNLPRVLADLHP